MSVYSRIETIKPIKTVCQEKFDIRLNAKTLHIATYVMDIFLWIMFDLFQHTKEIKIELKKYSENSP